MWIFTQRGFISAVMDKKGGPDTLIVRGRDRESLRDLSQYAGARIIDNEGTDYPFRVRVERVVFAGYMLKMVEELDYTNYKSAAGKKRDSVFTGALHSIWSTMLRLEPKRQYAPRSAGYPTTRPVTAAESVYNGYGSTPTFRGTGNISAPSRNHDPVGKRGSKRGKRGGKRRGQVFGENTYDGYDEAHEHAGYLSSLLDDSLVPPEDEPETVRMPIHWWDDVADSAAPRMRGSY